MHGLGVAQKAQNTLRTFDCEKARRRRRVSGQGGYLRGEPGLGQSLVDRLRCDCRPGGLAANHADCRSKNIKSEITCCEWSPSSSLMKMTSVL